MWTSGDVFVIAGQSNAQGRGTTLNSYIYSGIEAGKYTVSGSAWENMVDPVDGSSGSVWPFVARDYIEDRAAPVGFVPTAVSGSSSTSWLPGSTNYNNMRDRALAAVASGGTLKAVLWWQGETDSADGVSQSTYHANLAAIAAQIDTDLGVPMIVAKLQRLNIANAAALQAPIDAAVVQAWGDVANIRQGPDLSDLTADDSYHIMGNGKIATSANRWWTAIKEVFGWGT